jgi:hypothetical protein
MRAPGAGEDLVRPPSEEERVSGRVDVVEERADLLGHEREGPSAALESSAAVLVGSASRCMTASSDTDSVTVSFMVVSFLYSSHGSRPSGGARLTGGRRQLQVAQIGRENAD